MDVRTLIEDTAARLEGIPHVILESADILAPRAPETMTAFDELPPWLVELYTHLGGAHISWRLSPAGYEELNPGRKDNAYRYDISGNLDILSPEEVVGGFTGERVKWQRSPALANYFPVDFTDYYTNMGFVLPGAPGPAVNFLPYDALEQLEIPVIDYLRRGADLLYLDGWQYTLVTIEDSADISADVHRNLRRLTRLSSAAS